MILFSFFSLIEFFKHSFKSSLNVFTLNDLNCLSPKSNIWVATGTIAVGCFFPLCMNYIFLFHCLGHNFLLKTGNFKQQFVTILSSAPLPPGIGVVAGVFWVCLFAFVFLCAACLFSGFPGLTLWCAATELSAYFFFFFKFLFIF